MTKASLHILLIISASFFFSCSKTGPIDRYSLVTRHNVVNTSADSLNSLSVGNGNFAFTVDITGLQTFPESYERGIPLGTMSNWGWHTSLNPDSFSLKDVYKTYKVHGREVDYVHQFRPNEGARKASATDWLRTNPHRSHLGMIGFSILDKNGAEIKISDIKGNTQTLNLWTGEIESMFSVDGNPVFVRTICHPDIDMIAARIESPLIKENRLRIRIKFPLGTPQQTGYDFSSPDRHLTEMVREGDGMTLFERRQDNDIYFVRVLHKGALIEQTGAHTYMIFPSDSSGTYEFTGMFTKSCTGPEGEDFKSVEKKSAEAWSLFWTTGGAVDFSGCTDPRAIELERRVILSRYLTKVNCSGSLPPAETGLTYNTWYGKFHLEMHWWHGVHFALWQKEKILEEQLRYYNKIYNNALKTARDQGYRGVRWPKMTDPEGRESPSTVGTYLIWQQPHPVFYAELLYRNSDNKETVLNKYSELVFSSADFMASYAWPDSVNDRFVLGPVLIPAQESLNKETTINPSFELAYWYWGLKTACEWKRRMGMEQEPLWEDVVKKISSLPVRDGLYLCSEDTKDSYTNPRYMSDHPIVSGISGVLPEIPLVDKKVLGNSLDTIMKKWNWRTTWGWDFPMLAMSAASVGRGEQAIDFLLMDAPKNRYLLNGHNFQDATRLMIYLPGNGGLLTAVARMCVEDQFPHNGKWKVRWENLNSYVK